MIEQLEQCPVCGHTEFKDWQEVPDHFLSKENFQLQKCSNCHVLLTNPRPRENSIVKYYKSDSYISHSNQSKSIVGLIYKLVRNYTLGKKLKMLERYAFKGKLLDYGCGTGHFLARAKKIGWQVQGVEPDADARALAQGELGDEVKASVHELDQSYNVITLFHVLEHVHELEVTLKQLISRLDKNGVLFLALPNYLSHDAEHYGEHWAGYDVPRHLYHFNQRSVFQLSKKYGLNIVSTIPMKFDSYYVSMLSEKYRGNSASFIKGMLRGYKSNRKAKRSKEYSSLIYVLTQ